MSDLLDKIIKQNTTSQNYFFSTENSKNLMNEEEGELRADVYHQGNNIIIKSTIAGAKAQDVDISLHNDILTIRGKRNLEDEIDLKNYIHRECYWGAFSRSIILPCEVQKGRIKAIFKNGVLTVILPKIQGGKKITVKEVEE